MLKVCDFLSKGQKRQKGAEGEKGFFLISNYYWFDKFRVTVVKVLYIN